MPFDLRDPSFFDEAARRSRARARVRHLSRLPDVLQLLPVVSRAVRRHRRARGAAGGRDRRPHARREVEGRRPLLPVQALLREVPVHAAARVQRRLSAPDAARQGDAGPARGCDADRTGSSANPDRDCAAIDRGRGAARQLGERPAGAAEGRRDRRSASIATACCRRSRARRSSAGFAARGRRRRRDGERSVVLFETCSVDYNYPHIGAAAVQVLEHNGIRVERPPERCCGMPALDGGDIDAAAATARANVETFAAVRRARHADRRARTDLRLHHQAGVAGPRRHRRGEAGGGAPRSTLGEFLARARGGPARRTSAPAGQARVPRAVSPARAERRRALHGAAADDPRDAVEPIERCSAFDGTWGMKREYYDLSRKYGKKLFARARGRGAARLVSDCPLAGLNVDRGSRHHARAPGRSAAGRLRSRHRRCRPAENVWPGGAEKRCGRRACAGRVVQGPPQTRRRT